MAKKKTTAPADKTSKKKRGPFLPRVLKRLASIDKWIQSTAPKFTGTAAAGALKEMQDGLTEFADAVSKFEPTWVPAKGSSFVVGDIVKFKAEKLLVLNKTGLYTEADELDSDLTVTAVAGRKIRVDTLGIFPAVWFERVTEL